MTISHDGLSTQVGRGGGGGQSGSGFYGPLV